MTPCHPTCPGFAVFNAPTEGSPFAGEIQRCDACGSMTDDEARALTRAMGIKVSRKGIVTGTTPRGLRMLRLLGLL